MEATFNGTNLFFGTDTIKSERNEKGKSIIDFPSDHCVLDIETTGLSPDYDEIIEVGAIKYSDGKEVGRFQSLIQSPMQYRFDGHERRYMYVDPYITELTGITNEMLEGAPKADEVIPKYAEFIGQTTIVGYNVNFDINFLYDNFLRILRKPLSNDFVDIMRMARKLYPDMPHHRLADMTGRFGIVNTHAHRSLFDCEATETCLMHFYDDAIQQYGSIEDFIISYRRKAHGHHSPGYKALRAVDIEGDISKQDPDNPLYGRYCVFTGKLEKLLRKDAMKIVADLGGINEDTVTKNTNYLILGNNDYCTTIKDGKSSKQKKAEKNKIKGQDIEIIPEGVFYDMIGDYLSEQSNT
ncbi:MAG: exonuclease domain-containing protein [Lachnospiraceae bacterium]|nr:exonuclease domain-containing protein [Lachnospiraceae bacterium]